MPLRNECTSRDLPGADITTVGYGLADMTVPQGQRQLFTVSADFAAGEGDFHVGLCGSSTSPGTWNNHGNGYVTAFVHD